MANKNYTVEIIEAKGACDTALFKKMASSGDITSSRINDMIDKIVKINGYALCHITAGEKDFDINYYSTNEGIISSGSEVFKNSVLNYIDEDVYVKICKLKTKKGITYKVSPILVNEETGVVE